MLCGCGTGKKIKVKTDFLSFGCNIDYKDDKYSLDVTILENGEMDCFVTAPQTLVGMRCIVDDKRVKIDYMGIEIEKKLSEIPFGSAVSLFYAVMDDVSGKTLDRRGDNYYLSGRANGIEYTLFATEEGIPVSISFEKEKIFMEFVKLTLVNAKEK